MKYSWKGSGLFNGDKQKLSECPSESHTGLLWYYAGKNIKSLAAILLLLIENLKELDHS